MADATLDLRDHDEARALFGPNDRTLRLLRDRFGVEVFARDLRVVVRGDEAEAALAVLAGLLERTRAGQELAADDVDAAVGLRRAASARLGRNGGPQEGARPDGGIRLKTKGQERYWRAIEEHQLVFAIGPAGTGKTFLAVAQAVRALKAGEVQRIVLCRPAVEAGEKLGYLPGDFQAKVNPYMRPLYDALNGLLDFDTVKRYLEREVVEVAPLAFMRGRTLNRAFVILDEAQNTTKAQMKMFLTRMGEGSRIVVTGDVTQIDLPRGTTSGLVHAQTILRGVDGIAFSLLGREDIVRHPLVWKIVERYEGKGGA